MQIQATSISKKFNKEWIFRSFDHRFESSKSYGISGPNGSGKSTLLKILSQFRLPNEGKVSYWLNEKRIEDKACHGYLSYAAPYIDLIEEFSLHELLAFMLAQQAIAPIQMPDFLSYLQGNMDPNKPIKDYSSGMRQKIKLGLAMLSPKPILILDEPGTNLDAQAKEWFKSKMQEQQHKLVLLASNEAWELDLCAQHMNLQDYKK